MAPNAPAWARMPAAWRRATTWASGMPTPVQAITRAGSTGEARSASTSAGVSAVAETTQVGGEREQPLVVGQRVRDDGDAVGRAGLADGRHKLAVGHVALDVEEQDGPAVGPGERLGERRHAERRDHARLGRPDGGGGAARTSVSSSRPVPVVVRSSVSSCIRTRTPSAVRRTSVSISAGAWLSAYSNVSTAFSGRPGTGPPRWALTKIGAASVQRSACASASAVAKSR